jgi:hypothetical protein
MYPPRPDPQALQAAVAARCCGYDGIKVLALAHLGCSLVEDTLMVQVEAIDFLGLAAQERWQGVLLSGQRSTRYAENPWRNHRVPVTLTREETR